MCNTHHLHLELIIYNASSFLYIYSIVGDIIKYILGLLTLPGPVETMAFVNTKYQPTQENWPDIQIFFASALFLPQIDDVVSIF